ncbi:unnamed protein product [Zymoseptoria tritici ST99CH_3D7]|uniref:Uncharacterized protein n=2 Tax=Zymoseptoria tritici TaxID=1047171 RepID=A0A1X7S9B8_ZYMT9|nr:unnamed protein product [Zymoseptoria tritici ST99CH_3D7]SMR61940.1 unnamed protein product [Zymoseptoria tritici ST99CH_1E4]
MAPTICGPISFAAPSIRIECPSVVAFVAVEIRKFFVCTSPFRCLYLRTETALVVVLLLHLNNNSDCSSSAPLPRTSLEAFEDLASEGVPPPGEPEQCIFTSSPSFASSSRPAWLAA